MASTVNKSMKRKTEVSCIIDEIEGAPKIIKLSEDSMGSNPNNSNKIDKETNTEEEYVTEIETILKNYHENYKDLEVEEYKHMMQKFYEQNLRLATRCQKLKAAVEKTQTTTTRVLREASKHVNPNQLAFISAQLINNGKVSKKRVWSPQMKNIVVGLHQVSPAAFRFLSSIFLLPEEEEVSQWVSQGAESSLVGEDVKKKSGNEAGGKAATGAAKAKGEEKDEGEEVVTMEAQAVLDEIAFENLMATLL